MQGLMQGYVLGLTESGEMPIQPHLQVIPISSRLTSSTIISVTRCLAK